MNVIAVELNKHFQNHQNYKSNINRVVPKPKYIISKGMNYILNVNRFVRVITTQNVSINVNGSVSVIVSVIV